MFLNSSELNFYYYCLFEKFKVYNPRPRANDITKPTLYVGLKFVAKQFNDFGSWEIDETRLEGFKKNLC